MSQHRDRDRLYKRSVGLLVIATVVAALVVLRLYQQTAGPFRETLALYLTLPRADGVAVDTPVTLAGLRIGRVERVALTADNHVRVDLLIESQVADRIRRNSRAVLQRPLIGTAFIDIGIGSANQPRVSDGDRIDAIRAPDLNDLVATLPERLATIDAVLNDAQAISGELRRTVTTLTARGGPLDTAVANVAATTDSARQAASRLNATLVEVRQLVGEAARTIAVANETLADARSLAADLRPLGPRAVDMAASVERSLRAVEALAAELRALSPQLGPALVAGQMALDEADTVLRAAKGSFLLRGAIPQPPETPAVPVPRP